MKIGIFTDAYPPQLNGVATSVSLNSEELSLRGHEVFVVAPKYPDYKDKGNIFRLKSIKVNKDFNARVAVTPIGRSFLKLLKVDFDVIHGHSGGSVSLMGLIMAKIKRVPYVFTYHTLWTDYTHYLARGLINSKMVEFASKIHCNRCNCVIAPSNKVKEELISYGIKKPIVVIPSGVNYRLFGNAKNYGLRKKLGLKGNDQILLYVGRLGKEKSVDFLIYAFNIIVKFLPNTHFVIAGSGNMLSYLKSLTQRLNLDKNIHFLGFIESIQIPSIYRDGNLFMFSSKTETQGIVILEAMASGLPVVSVQDKAIEEMIENNIDGILVNKNINTFAETVVKLLKNKKLCERLGKNAQKKARLLSDQSILSLEDIYYRMAVKNIKI